MSEQSHNVGNDGLMRDFLLWIEREPRTHADVMDAWRSSCPRLTVWEDALIDGLVKLEPGIAPQRVSITTKGSAWLKATRPTRSRI